MAITSLIRPCLLHVLFGIPLSAQFLGGFRPHVQWEERLYIQVEDGGHGRALVQDEKGKLVAGIPKIPLPGEGTTIHGPYRIAGDYFATGSYSVQTEDGSFEISELWRFQKTWEKVGRHKAKPDQGALQVILPLGDGKYLGVSYWAGFWPGEPQSRFGLLSLAEKNEFRVSSGLALGIDGLDNRGFLGPLDVIVADGYIYLVERNAGLIWMIDREDGHVRRQIRVCECVTAERLKKKDYWMAVLACEPTPEGDLILACRSEEAVVDLKSIESMRLAEERVGQATDTPEGQNTLTRAFELLAAAMKAHPEVRWLKLDSVEGKLSRMDPPPGAPERVENLPELMGFNFFTGPGGGISFKGWEDLRILAEPEDAKEKEGVNTTGKKSTGTNTPGDDQPKDAPGTGQQGSKPHAQKNPVVTAPDPEKKVPHR